jgi:transcription antitermination protein NusB
MFSSPAFPSSTEARLPTGGPRHQARELALKTLFQLENRVDDDPVAVLEYHAGEADVANPTRVFASQLVLGVRSHVGQLDEIISGCSRNWRIEQMGKVDRIVLRIAIYEIVVARNVPVRAAINESVVLAKTFAGEESGRFVNGILGKVAEMAGG